MENQNTTPSEISIESLELVQGGAEPKNAFDFTVKAEATTEGKATLSVSLTYHF